MNNTQPDNPNRDWSRYSIDPDFKAWVLRQIPVSERMYPADDRYGRLLDSVDPRTPVHLLSPTMIDAR